MQSRGPCFYTFLYSLDFSLSLSLFIRIPNLRPSSSLFLPASFISRTIHKHQRNVACSVFFSLLFFVDTSFFIYIYIYIHPSFTLSVLIRVAFSLSLSLSLVFSDTHVFFFLFFLPKWRFVLAARFKSLFFFFFFFKG